MAFENLKVKIYADGAKIEDMLAAYNGGTARGFTTNPSLMKKAGITDYKAFAKDVLAQITDASVSFVFCIFLVVYTSVSFTIHIGTE